METDYLGLRYSIKELSQRTKKAVNSQAGHNRESQDIMDIHIHFRDNNACTYGRYFYQVPFYSLRSHDN